MTRPDVTYVVQQLSQFVNDPYTKYLDVVFHVLKYLRGTSSFGLLYPSIGSFELQDYIDTDWIAYKDTH